MTDTTLTPSGTALAHASPKIRFSLSTKVLISVMMILLATIVFLDYSTITILVEDKKTQTFHTQGLESEVISQNFANVLHNAIEQARSFLGAVDPNFPPTEDKILELQNAIKNQTEVLALQFVFWDSKSQFPKPYVKVTKAPLYDSIEPPADQIKNAMDSILKDGVFIANVTQKDDDSLLVVGIADLRLRNHPSGLPISLAFLSKNNLVGKKANSDMLIANRQGDVLFATNPDFQRLAGDPLFLFASTSPLSSGVREFSIGDSEYFGSFKKLGLGIMVLSRTPWNKAMRGALFLAEKFILLGCMALTVAALFSIFFSKTLTINVNRIFRATKEIAKGNFDVVLKVRSKDEIGALAESFSMMSERIKSLIVDSVQKVHLENEIAIASTVQRNLFPDPVFKNDRVLIHSFFQSASECGGDWWGQFFQNEKLWLMIGDATGHGLPSALITAAARSNMSMFEKIVESTSAPISPQMMLDYANRCIFDAAKGQIMMTMFATVFDFQQQTLSFANGAHNPPYVLRREGESYSLTTLKGSGLRLGETKNVAEIEHSTEKFQSGDIFFFYTDGLLECSNESKEMYGKKRIREILKQSANQGPEGLVTSMVNDFKNFVKDKAYDDDVTIVALQIL